MSKQCQRVVVTGLGTISALGIGVKPFWECLSEGRSGIADLPKNWHAIRTSSGARVPAYCEEDYFSRDALPLLDRFSQFAVLAGREAIQDAGLETAALENAAAVIGTGCGGKQTDEDTYTHLYKTGKTRAHPLTIPKGMPSASASQISIHLGITGAVFTISSACASGAHAAIQGAIMIEAGLTDVAIVGASDAPFTYGLLKSWEALRVLSPDTCRPFCADRGGLVLGEGAGMLVLESEQHARSRGARIYAGLSGYGQTADAGHITRPQLKGVIRSMRGALERAELNADQISYINAHGTATRSNDPLESQAIHRLYGEHARKLAVSSTKSMHGHALGASSALEQVATVLALYHQYAPPTANFTTPDPECDLDYVPNTGRSIPIQHAASHAFAFGGLNAVLVFSQH
ncbi:3-oxoacyl-[acyl-carrier-protein] synthase, KASII [hydrothermal vent metagenome]|uniref:Nodulation protein E n=1 Tax=hydrothermal vent metagenome TaxID=652676 RepID=A0A3B0YA96_9ZZZZ